MGASNALSAFRLYAAKVPSTAMSALAYMALVSLDADVEPWFSLGAETLAVMALGREPLTETGDGKEDAKARKAMEVACERALRPLFTAGAITTVRHSSGQPGRARHARYRLWLSEPAPDDARDPRHRSTPAPYENRGVQNSAEHASPSDSENVAPYENHGVPDDSALRNSCQHPTETVPAPYETRGAKEYEEHEERKENLEEYSFPSPPPVPVRAREAPDDQGEMDSGATKAAPWLSLACPHCSAEPGKPCVNIGTGKTRDPHDARTTAAA